MAEKFFNTPYNMPWVKVPVSFIEGNTAFVVYDPINKPNTGSTIHLSYIKKPISFVTSLKENINRGVFILDQSRLNSEDRIQ